MGTKKKIHSWFKWLKSWIVYLTYRIINFNWETIVLALLSSAVSILVFYYFRDKCLYQLNYSDSLVIIYIFASWV